MYNLEEFCNVIARLRKEKGWTQTVLAKKLGISAQSISKWECGIGYPDVTLFPVIAELFSVPIGVIFGEKSKENKMMKEYEYSKKFKDCKQITVYFGNICKVEFIENTNGVFRIEAEGDPVFIKYFDAEQADDQLTVQIKNPSGSVISWKPYDREGYTGENLVRIYVGNKDVGYNNVNYLDLQATARDNEQTGNYEIVCDRLNA